MVIETIPPHGNLHQRRERAGKHCENKVAEIECVKIFKLSENN